MRVVPVGENPIRAACNEMNTLYSAFARDTQMFYSALAASVWAWRPQVRQPTSSSLFAR